MTRRQYAALFLLGLAVACAIAWFQTAPGTMDEAYYFAGGLRLVQGHGFTETYLWNYLDNPTGLPHPSHGYWFPLASILSAVGMFLTGQQSFLAGRLGFIVVAALVPPVTAALAYSFTARRDVSLIAGLLAVFPSYEATFMATSDNFGPFMLLGGLFFILLMRPDKKAILALGLVAGLLNLARSDGLLWLAVGALGLFLRLHIEKYGDKPLFSLALLPSYLKLAALLLVGYLLIMAPWMARNLSVFGVPLTPGGGHVLWMTDYSDTFAFPPDRVNLQNWLAAGWQSAAAGRWEAFKLNFANTIAVQGGIALLPFILIGVWRKWNELRVRLAVLAWLGLFAIMTLVFPFAGSRGSFLHAGAALQPLWWAMAPVGLDYLVGKARQRGWFTPQAFTFFRVMLVAVMAVLTIFLIYTRVIKTDLSVFNNTYIRAEKVLLAHGASAQDVVVAANSPGYFVATGRAAVTVPAENPLVLQALAQRYRARFLVLEKNYMPDQFSNVYDFPNSQPGLKYLAGFDEVRVFEIEAGK